MFSGDDDKRPIYTLLTGTIARLTNLKYENVDRYQEMDSKLRIRLTVVARGPSYLTNEEVYWTEVSTPL